MLQICKANFEIVKDIMPFEHALQKYSQCCQAFHNCKMEQRGICVFDVSSNKETSKSPSLGLPQLLLQLLLAVALCTLVLTLPPLACAGFFAAFDFAHAFAVVLSCEMIDNTRFIMFGPACDH